MIGVTTTYDYEWVTRESDYTAALVEAVEARLTAMPLSRFPTEGHIAITGGARRKKGPRYFLVLLDLPAETDEHDLFLIRHELKYLAWEVFLHHQVVVRFDIRVGVRRDMAAA